MHLFLNFGLFQLGWFSSVLGGANQMPWAGPVAVLIVIAVHLRLARRPAKEIALILCCAAIGAVFDSVLVAMGWVSYKSGMFLESLAPYWIIGMWMLFATTLNVSLRWLRSMPLVAAFLGLIAGPLTYIGGAKLGGIVFVDQGAALAMLGFGWAIMMPLLLVIGERFDGVKPTPAPVAARAAA